MGLDILYGVSTTFNKMKITILGRGNAGCISALYFNHFGKFLDQKIEIELIYDSKIPPVPVGQATIVPLPFLLWQSLGITAASDFEHTIKTGVMYENWGNKNEKIFHELAFANHGIHFEPKNFQDIIVNNLKIKFKEKDENIIDYKEIDEDYIIDCRGKPKNLDKDYTKLINPLNHALLSSVPLKDKEVSWTKAIATKDGWCFYIPLRNKVALGYNFNSEITPLEEAKENFKEFFSLEKIDRDFNIFSMNEGSFIRKRKDKNKIV
jgi:hypothetical protein